MSAYKVQQRYLSHRGRSFHFVSYEGHPANPAKQTHAQPPCWYLIASGKRWHVMVQEPSQTSDQCDRRFMAWLDENVFRAS